MKLWQGRLSGENDALFDALNSSIGFDCRMYEQDIAGSIAHAGALFEMGVLSEKETAAITNALQQMTKDIQSGALEIDLSMEDIHTFVEAELTRRVGDAGKKIHTARSRNDQVALDLRLYLSDQAHRLTCLLKECISTLCQVSEAHVYSVMPGYTHMQRAQPVTLAHHLMAYAQMFLRDIDRLKDCAKRIEVSPLGAGALAGTTYLLNRDLVATALGFHGVCANSMDAVADRDFVIELSSALSIAMLHLSRIAEEVVLWNSWEFKFLTLADSYSTGSSIMPQKKNPDPAELIRGKSARVIGANMTLLSFMRSLPLAYNKDMQEDKEAIFDAVDTLALCLSILPPMIKTATFHVENMKKAASEGFINATDCADYLTKKGMPFRDAYFITGKLVNRCMETGKTLESLSLAEYKGFSPLFEEDVYQAIDLIHCVSQRKLEGGPAPEAVRKQIARVKEDLDK